MPTPTSRTSLLPRSLSPPTKPSPKGVAFADPLLYQQSPATPCHAKLHPCIWGFRGAKTELLVCGNYDFLAVASVCGPQGNPSQTSAD